MALQLVRPVFRGLHTRTVLLAEAKKATKGKDEQKEPRARKVRQPDSEFVKAREEYNAKVHEIRKQLVEKRFEERTAKQRAEEAVQRAAAEAGERELKSAEEAGKLELAARLQQAAPAAGARTESPKDKAASEAALKKPVVRRKERPTKPTLSDVAFAQLQKDLAQRLTKFEAWRSERAALRAGNRPWQYHQASRLVSLEDAVKKFSSNTSDYLVSSNDEDILRFVSARIGEGLSRPVARSLSESQLASVTASAAAAANAAISQIPDAAAAPAPTTPPTTTSPSS